MSEVWATGEMLCLGEACDYEGGVHLWMIGSEPVECPQCGENFCVPKEAETLWSE